ncbi:hypothetical protein MRX96_014785 [Rhipicephalus microplus]
MASSDSPPLSPSKESADLPVKATYGGKQLPQTPEEPSKSAVGGSPGPSSMAVSSGSPAAPRNSILAPAGRADFEAALGRLREQQQRYLKHPVPPSFSSSRQRSLKLRIGAPGASSHRLRNQSEPFHSPPGEGKASASS